MNVLLGQNGCLKNEETNGKLMKSLQVVCLLTENLHDDCSLSGVDVGFHENQRLPSAKNCLAIYNRQGFVWTQQHRSKMGMRI